MRLYSFTNMYTSGIHAGIQTAHVVHEMMHKYELKARDVAAGRISGDKATRVRAKKHTLDEWVEKHKTIIVKTAGYHQALVDLYAELKPYSAHFDLPLARWRESKDALNNAQTAVAIVVPKNIYNGFEPLDPNDRDEHVTGLRDIINRYRMAS